MKQRRLDTNHRMTCRETFRYRIEDVVGYLGCSAATPVRACNHMQGCIIRDVRAEHCTTTTFHLMSEQGVSMRPLLRAEALMIRREMERIHVLVQCDAAESFYRFPGGSIETGETASTTIVRELLA